MKIKEWILQNLLQEKLNEFTNNITNYHENLASATLENLQIEMENKQKLLDQIKSGNPVDVDTEGEQYNKKTKSLKVVNDKLFNKSIFNTLFKNELLELVGEIKHEVTNEYSYKMTRMNKILDKQQKEINSLIKDKREQAIKINTEKAVWSERQTYPSNLID